LDLFDDIKFFKRELNVFDTTADPAERAIDEFLFSNRKNNTSKFLKWDDFDSSKHNSNRDGVGNPFLFRSVFWSIPRETTSEWSVITISGCKETSVLPKIIIPKKYAKYKTAEGLQKINDKWWETFVSGKTNKMGERIFTAGYYD
jgi:hypothetical protein